MKINKLLFFVLLIASLKITYGQENWISFAGQTEGEAELNIQTSNSSEVIFIVNLPGMYVKDVTGYQRLRIKGFGKSDSTGYPELPLLKYLTAVPICDSVIISIQPLDSVTLNNYNVYPVPELVEQTNSEGFVYLAEQFTKNDSIYNANQYYTGNIGNIAADGAIREQQISEVHLLPVQFNPVQQNIKVYHSLQVHLTFINPLSDINVETGIFNGVCHTSIINYNTGGISSAINVNSSVSGSVERLNDINTQNVVCDYLIISANSLFNNSYIDDLAWHRAGYNGFDVKIIDVSIITIDPLISDYVEIRDYIKNLYINGTAIHTYDGHVAYVCLIGDAYDDLFNNMLPASNAYSQFEKASDYYYSCLTTQPNDPTKYDNYGDVWIGRLPTGNALELENVVNKIIAYEPIDETSVFFNNITFVEGNEPIAWAEPVGEWIRRILDFIPQEKYITLYSQWQTDPLLNPNYPAGIDDLIWDTNLSNAFSLYYNPLLSNDGQYILSYFGHGNTDCIYGFCKSQISSLNTDGKFPLFFLSACATGWFDGVDFDCFAEVGVNSEQGIIGSIASSRSTVDATFALQEDFYENLFDPYTGFMGEILLAAKLKSANNLSQRQYNLFSDPGINMVYTSQLLTNPDFTFSKNTISLNPENPRYQESFTISVDVFNNSITTYSGNVEVRFYLENQETNDIHYIGSSNVSGINGWETKIVSLNYANNELDMGHYTLIIKIDEYNTIDEIIETNNYVDKSNILISKILPVFPVNFTASGMMANTFFYPVRIENNYLVGSSMISSEGNILWQKNDLPYFQPSAVYYNQWYIFECMNVNEEPKKLKLFNINGTELWQMDLPFPAVSQPFCIKYNDDVFFYILAEGIEERTATLYYKNISGTMEGALTIETGIPIGEIEGVAINDLDTDGISEIVFSYKNSNDGTINVVSINKNIFSVFYTNFGTSDNVLFKPIIFDSNSDGNQEIIQLCSDISGSGKVFTFQFDGTNIQQTGELNVSEIGSHLNVVTDLDDDGHLHVVSFYDNKIQLVDILNSTSDEIELDKPVKSILTARISGNIQSDIIAAVDDWIYIINDGAVIQKYPVRDDNNVFGMSMIDIDNVPHVLINNDDEFYIMDLLENYSEIEWGQPFYNNQNNYSFPKLLIQNISENISLNGEYIVYNDVEIATGITAGIYPGSLFKFKQNSSFKIYGNFISSGSEYLPIKFDGLDTYSINWDGLEFYPTSGCTLNYCQIRNAQKGIYIKPNSESFNNHLITNCEISDCNDGIYTVLNNVDIRYNNIHHNHTGIYLSQSDFNIYANTISSNYDHGIYIYNSSYGEIIGNTINNNSVTTKEPPFAAITLYHSSPGIFANQITNNYQNGILLLNESFPLILESNLISENGPIIEMTEPAWIKAEILMQDISVPYMNYGHNDIFHENVSEPDHLLMHAGKPDDIIYVNGNYWGGGNPESRLYPLEYFEFDEWDEEPNTTGRSSQGDPEEQLFISSLTAEKQGDYQAAKTGYQQIISNYPDSIETTYSLNRLFVCEQSLNGDFTQLQNYYAAFSQNTADSVNSKVAKSMVRRCMVQQLQLDPAIADYEVIVQNSPALADSVYAVIDIGEIYLLQEELDSTGTQLMKGVSAIHPGIASLKPVDRNQFEKKKSDLLAMLFSAPGKKGKVNIPTTYALQQNYPNPFNPVTTIKYQLPKTSKVKLEIFNILGQKIITLINSQKAPAYYEMQWNGKNEIGNQVASGVYIYRFSAESIDGSESFAKTKKMLLIR